MLLAETGLRIAELCALRIALPVPDQILVRGKGGRERILPLSTAAREALDRLGGRILLSPRTIQRHFAAVGMTPHRLRHHLACQLAEADVDLSVIQDLLGHASPATTRVYMANRVERLRAGLEARR